MNKIQPGSIAYDVNPPVKIVGEMSMRDYFAAHVVMGMYAGDYDLSREERAEAAYEMADIMLKQRRKKK